MRTVPIRAPAPLLSRSGALRGSPATWSHLRPNTAFFGVSLTMLKDAARVVRPGGTIAVFDGDYASWTFACPGHALGKAMEEGIIAVVVNQPRVMRDMPRLLREAKLERMDILAYVYADIGKGVFFPSAMEGLAPLVAREGLVAADQVDVWLTLQRQAMEGGIFFAACNYYAYIAKRGG